MGGSVHVRTCVSNRLRCCRFVIPRFVVPTQSGVAFKSGLQLWPSAVSAMGCLLWIVRMCGEQLA